MEIKESIYIDDVLGPLEKYSYQVIPNGETWEITTWWGSANAMRDTHVCIIWDYDTVNEEYIAITHSAEKRDLFKTLVGDGTKKLAIVLRNDTALVTETLGAGYIYKVL